MTSLTRFVSVFTKYCWLPLVLLFTTNLRSQELYPMNEPASNIPKGALGIRAFSTLYPEAGITRNMFALRLMYGVTSKLSVYVTGNVANHHGSTLPPDLATHVHNGNQTVYSTNTIQRGVRYAYAFNGVSLYAKYRFYTLDQRNMHLRIAAYGDLSNANTAHDEAEPTLLDDTKGFGAGIITTYLKHHFAISLTTGGIFPTDYQGYTADPYGGIDVPTRVRYGRAFAYNLSMGYLIFPRHYKSYDQLNWNLYLELNGKTFGQARIVQGVEKTVVPIQTPLLQAGNFVEAYPGIQCIIKSNLRVDFSIGFPLLNQSYARFYPIYMLSLQRYFFGR